jgi:hypothetical protein
LQVNYIDDFDKINDNLIIQENISIENLNIKICIYTAPLQSHVLKYHNNA